MAVSNAPAKDASDQRPPRNPTPPRERVLAAALTCFVRAGFHGTSMHEICAEAHMSPGAVYRYFPSKDAIIEAIAAEERANNRRFLDRLDVEQGVLRALLETGFAWMRDVSGREAGALCVEVLAEAHRNPRIREIFERNLEEAREALCAAVRRGQANGEIEPNLDPGVTASVIMALGDGLLARMPLEPQLAPDRIEAALTQLIHRMLAPASPHAMAIGAAAPQQSSIVQEPRS